MIDLSRQKLILGDIEEKIKEYSVWWKTPSGLFKTVFEALKNAEDNGVPAIAIYPVPVAISNSTYEVMASG